MVLKLLKVVLIAILLARLGYAQETQYQSSDVTAVASTYRGLLDRYCVSCHNEALKTANLMLDKANVVDISENPRMWERVVTKLVLRAMPPVGIPIRPNESEYEGFVTYLQTELDRLAEINLNPGRPTVHRLNRTEYANSIRDLLHMEIDATEFLPPDNISVGFDNIAEVLAVSPLLMERYMFAAGRISSLAVGPPSMQPAGETYYLSDSFHQDARMSEDLPFGSRGGVAVHHHFPLDGEYTISVTLQRNLEGYIRGLRDEHTLDVRLDHKSIGRLAIGGEVHGRSGPYFTSDQNAHRAGDLEQIGYEFTADKDLKVHFSANAGSRLVGVTFVDEDTKSTGIKIPRLTLPDILSYKGGNPGVATVTITGPYEAKGPGQTPSREKIFVCRPEHDDDVKCAGQILSNLAHQAYRRPVTEYDMEQLLGLFQTGRSDGGFERGIELALQGILAGPEFLFRIEKDPPGAPLETVHPINDLELASRLSFFLWSSIPDAELLEIAENGKLRDAGVLEQQVQRMMRNPRFDAFIRNFSNQWLSIRNIDIAAPNMDIFLEFDEELREAFKQEMLLWFESMITKDSSVLELLTSDYTFVNERLARHYGISGIYGSRFRPVPLATLEERQGLLGKGGFLLATSYNNRTSPVLRGKWILENLLDMPPAPAPPDVPALELASGDGKALSMREAMESHRANPVCAACHKLMDPLGFALENFDAIGAYRTRYTDANAEVDPSGILFDGNKFENTTEFRQNFLKHSERVSYTVTEKVLTYALGRGLEYYDQPAVREIVQKIAPENYSWSSLILAIIESMPFQYRRIISHDDI